MNTPANLERMQGVDWMRAADHPHGHELVVPALCDALERLTGQEWTHTIAGLLAINDKGGTCHRCRTHPVHWLIVVPADTYTEYVTLCDSCPPPADRNVVSVPTPLLDYWTAQDPELAAVLADRRRRGV